jgi:hypothetical protein
MQHLGINEMVGSGAVRTTLSLEELAPIISNQLFGGLPFGGREKSIWEEVPAVFINTPVLGSLVVLGRGNNQGAPGNCFVLSVSPWGDFDRYLYRNKVPSRTIHQYNYFYHLLKFALQKYPDIEVLGPGLEAETAYPFRLAERIVQRFDKMFNYNKERTGFISFKESVVDSSSLKIVFSNTKDEIICSLSMHPLDMPWAFQVKAIFEDGTEFELHKWIAEKNGNNEVAYEVTPNLLHDPEFLGNELAMTMATDTQTFLREVRRY